MEKTLRFIFDRNLIFTLSFFLGLLLPEGLPYTLWLLLPSLALVIAVSTLSVGSDIFRSPRVFINNSLVGVAVNYLLMSGVTILAGYLLVSDPQLRAGFVLVAAVPAASAVVPFADVLGGDRTLALLGMIGGLLFAFVMLPLITVLFVGSNLLDPKKLLLILVELSIVPLLVSRLFRAVRLDTPMEPYRGPITNLSLGVAFYIMVAVNHDIIVHQTPVLVRVVIVGLIISVVSGGIVLAAARILSVDRRTQISLLLLATLKNYAISAGLGLILFSSRAALPSVVMTIIMIPYIVVLDLFVRRGKMGGEVH